MSGKIASPLLLLLPFAALLIACGGGDDKAASSRPAANAESQPRSFLMGVSALPGEPGVEAYRDAFKTAGSAGEVVLIQRAPPWSDFVPGAGISERTERLTRFEKDLAKENDLRLFLAVDPTEPSDRGRLANLPGDLKDKDFSDSRVRAAFVAYAKYLALNYKPAYLALGVEVDMFYDRRGDAAFRSFLSLYFEAYDAVKSVSASTLVFPTFQYENMQGKLLAGVPAPPAWPLVTHFEPKIDLLAVSSFPGLIFPNPAAIPPDYYDALKGRSKHPVAFTALGWSSVESAGGQDGQVAYMTRAFAAAEAQKSELLIWYLGRDPKSEPMATSPQLLPAMGVLDSEGKAKAALALWQRQAERPLQQ